MRVEGKYLLMEGVSRAIRASNDLQTSPSSPERQMTVYALFGNGSRFRDKSKLIVHPKVGSSSPLPHHDNHLRYWWEAPDSATLTRRKDHLCHIIPALITTLSSDLRILIPLHVLIMVASN
jgi:hypothetical protein